jgi:hypothetical protein
MANSWLKFSGLVEAGSKGRGVCYLLPAEGVVSKKDLVEKESLIGGERCSGAVMSS